MACRIASATSACVSMANPCAMAVERAETSRLPPHQQERQVVVRALALVEVRHLGKQPLDQFRQGPVAPLQEEPAEPVQAVALTAAAGLDQAVAAQDEEVARGQLDGGARLVALAEQAEGAAARLVV